jgi:FMN-dependent NADH-azoreductase
MTTHSKETSMKTLLDLRTSIHSDQGVSSRLAADFVTAWRDANPTAKVITRDLARDPVPHLTAETFAAFLAKPEARTPAQQAAAGFSDALIAELKAADTLVLGLPMYNFGIPSTLKAYFDHVARSGQTFSYTEKGPEGLLKGKKAVVFATRGGLYAGTPKDTQTSYVRDFLAFLGIVDVEFVYAEGLAMGEAPRKLALDTAAVQLRALANARPEALAQAA